MRPSILRYFLSWTLLLVVPSSLLGQISPGQTTDTGSAAILHTQGGVWVNGYEARDSSAVFPGDIIETKKGFSGSLSLDGASVILAPESVGKLGANFLELDHGNVSVGTSKRFEVHVNCMRVVPVVAEWTQYEVADVNRTVQVAARKDDVNVDHGMTRKAGETNESGQRASVHEGEQHNYDESELCGAPPEPKTAAGLNAKWIGIGGAAVGGAVLCALLCRGSSPKPSISPSSF
ncbi:MAG TPA: hypothetical protein VMB66_01635 [Candidatus Acidoferrales bacterium]|nr:hypothetical protein [Candidatus Acidoferrales bacterium]